MIKNVSFDCKECSGDAATTTVLRDYCPFSMVVGMTRVGATGGASMTNVTAICFTFCTDNSFHPTPILLSTSSQYGAEPLEAPAPISGPAPAPMSGPAPPAACCDSYNLAKSFYAELGISDYGLYSVVGGIVTMFTFING